MRSSKIRARVAAIVAVSAIAAATAASPATAHPGQASCRGFGLEHAFFAKELGGLGQFFRDAAPLRDEVAFEHALFCEAK